MRVVQGPETGGTAPRSAHSGNTSAVLWGGLALFVIAPAALVSAVVCVFVIVRQVRRHWWEWALVALGAAAVVGAVMQWITGNVLAEHFGGYLGALRATVPGGHDLLGAWWSAFVRTVPLGVPIGIAAGAAYVGVSEGWAGRAEWHRMEQHRRAVVSTKQERKIARLAADTDAQARCSGIPLGVARDGDLTSWTQRGYVVAPPGRFPAMGLLGESGSGKTETAKRLVSIWARSGRKVFFADFKGSDPDLAAEVIAAYKAVRPDAMCAFWPAQPLDMWRGTPKQVLNRLLCVQDFTEPYYKGVAETAVRLAVEAPDIDGRGPVADSASFMARLDAGFLKSAYEGTPQAKDVTALIGDPKSLAGVRMRYAGFFAALGGLLDHGWSFEDVDLAVLSVPTLAQASDAMAVARMILLDFGAYCMARKPRKGEDVTFIVDEFSAVTSAAPMVIDLAERVRDVGGQVVVSAQSWGGLGRDDDERRRMRDALVPGGLIVHRMADPDKLIEPAGTVRAIEASTQLDEYGHTGMGSARMAHKMKVDPDAVRQAGTGEAWVITNGRAAHLSVLQARIPAEVLAHARLLVAAAWAQAREDFTYSHVPEPRDWWEFRPPQLERSRLELEAGSLGELGPGDPEPAELPPGPKPPDPRLMLAVAAYVRAGQIADARQMAAAGRVPESDRYVGRLAAKRAAQLNQSNRRWRLRRRRGGRKRPGRSRP